MFFIIPVGVDYRARRYPIITFSLMGACVLLYVVSFLLLLTYGNDDERRYWLIENLGLVPANPTWFSWITSMFVHAGLFHLLGNMIYLFLFGACVEDLIGRGWFLLFYLVGGLFANVADVMLSGSEYADIPLVGASGAISACLGGFVVMLARTKINFRYVVILFIRFWSGDFWFPAWPVISGWFILDLFSAIKSADNIEASEGIAFIAHVGGFIIGFLWMLIYRAKANKDQSSSEVTPLSTSPKKTITQKRFTPIKTEQPTIFLYHNEIQSGPFTVGHVRNMLTSGNISNEAYYCREGMTEWRPVQELESDTYSYS